MVGFPGRIPVGCRTRIALIILSPKNHFIDPTGMAYSNLITQGNLVFKPPGPSFLPAVCFQ